jgi:hypothetical protein
MGFQRIVPVFLPFPTEVFRRIVVDIFDPVLQVSLNAYIEKPRTVPATGGLSGCDAG